MKTQRTPCTEKAAHHLPHYWYDDRRLVRCDGTCGHPNHGSNDHECNPLVSIKAPFAAPSESSASPDLTEPPAIHHPDCTGDHEVMAGRACCVVSSASPEPRCHVQHDGEGAERLGYVWREDGSLWGAVPCPDPPSAPGGSSRHSDERALLVEQIAMALRSLWLPSAGINDYGRGVNAAVIEAQALVRSFATGQARAALPPTEDRAALDTSTPGGDRG